MFDAAPRPTIDTQPPTPEPPSEKLIRVYLSLPTVLEVLTIAEKREGTARIHDFLTSCLRQEDFATIISEINPAELTAAFLNDLNETYGDYPNPPQNISELQDRLIASQHQPENKHTSANTLEYLYSHILDPLLSVQETIPHLSPETRIHLIRLQRHKQEKLARLLLSLRELHERRLAGEEPTLAVAA